MLSHTEVWILKYGLGLLVLDCLVDLIGYCFDLLFCYCWFIHDGIACVLEEWMMYENKGVVDLLLITIVFERNNLDKELQSNC